MRMEAPGLPEPFEMSGNGVEDASKRRGHFTFESPMTGSMEMVSDDMTLYMRSDLFAPHSAARTG